MYIRRRLIRQTAQEVLQRHGVNAGPVDVEGIAKAEGITLRKVSGKDDQSGFLLIQPGAVPPVIGVNADHSTHRRRFTIAHELGHYFLHRGEPMHLDNITGIVFEERSEASTRGIEPKEMEANAFAAELLMPEPLVHAAVEAERTISQHVRDEAVLRLAKRFNVSVTAMTIRLQRLNYIIL